MSLTELRISEHDDIVVARAVGEIDMVNAAKLHAATVRGTRNEAAGLILDLTGTDYLDSAGIRLIYNLRESLSTRGQGLWLVIPADSMIHDTLRLAGVGQHFQVTDTLDQALEAARG